MIKKILLFVFTLWAIASITFVLMRLAPGGPYSSERTFTEDVEAEISERYSIKGSFFRQYASYIKNVFTLDFGPSLKYRDISVSEIISESLPVSAVLGLGAFAIAFFTGIIMGFIAGKYRNGLLGKVVYSLSILGISIPLFALAILFVIVFSFRLKILPVAGWGDFSSFILPAFCLSLPYSAAITNLFRTAYIGASEKESIYYAKEREVTKMKIFFKYVLRDALSPVVSYSAPAIAGLLTGSIVIENIFAVPGIGTHFVNAALNRDYTLLFGVVLVYSSILVFLNFTADSALKWLNPRIRE